MVSQLPKTSYSLPESPSLENSFSAGFRHAALNAEKMQAQEELREFLHDARQTLKGDISEWPKKFARFVLEHTRALEQRPDSYSSMLCEFLSELKGPVKFILSELKNSHKNSDIAHTAIELIHSVSEIVYGQLGITKLRIPFELITFDELTKNFPDQIKRDGRNLCVKAKTDGEWHNFPVPLSGEWIHKGGFPRVLLKIYAGAPQSTIDAELPANDLDAIALKGSRSALIECESLGIGREGIEEVSELDIANIISNRDLTSNSCFVSHEGLIFTDAAHSAASTGITSLLYSEERPLYGADFFLHEGVRLLKDRGLARVMKSVIEGKSLGFDLIPRNTQVDLGVYWLLLARRFAGKPDAANLLSGLYEVGKQCGQIKDGENNIFDVLHRVHSEHSYFDFESPPLDNTGVARWLAGKVAKEMQQVFKRTVQVPRASDIMVREGDLTPRHVSLTSKPEALKDAASEWENFIISSNERHRAYKQSTEAS